MTPAPDNRRWPRRPPVPGEPLRRARARMGHELDVIDISDAGVLVEGRARLLPNTSLDAHFVLRTGRVLIRCRVVRAYVCHVEADLVRYRAGLVFDHVVDTSGGYSVPAGISREFQAVGSTYPDLTFDQAAVAARAAST